jgi:hypothetical protein
MEVENMKKTIEIHDALADPPKKSGEYIAFSVCESETGEYLGGYWTQLTYGKDVNSWNVSIDPLTGLTRSADCAFNSVSHWFEAFDPNKEEKHDGKSS